MNTDHWPPAIREVLAEERLNELGPGRPNEPAQELLKNLTVDKAFAPEKVADRALAQACLAGLWLYHDYLEESHQISQNLSSAEGSYWHGLMHRREPDYGNAKYWFRRVGSHPIFDALAEEARKLAEGKTPANAQFLVEQKTWDPLAFVDWCEKVATTKSTDALLCREIQKREWEILFDYCYQRTVAR